MRTRSALVVTILFAVTFADFQPKTWVVNIDEPAYNRWPAKDLIAVYKESLNEAVAILDKFIPKWQQPIFEEGALMVLSHLGDYADEIRSLSDASGISLGKITLLNIIYEVEAGCTSIVAQDTSGNIYQARNLDFPLSSVLRNITIQVEFQSKGKTLYYGTTYVGYVGLLTGMKTGYFSISADQRNSGYTWENLLEALLVPGTSVASMLIRDTLQYETTFSGAVKKLKETPLAAPIYIIVGGTKQNEGAVITRDRNWAADVWVLSQQDGRWFEVETNYDHWSSDTGEREKVANEGMSKLGQQALGLLGMFKVLSTPPVLNDITTYTTLMSPLFGNYTTFVRTGN